MAAATGALERCVGSVDRFLRDFWTRAPLHRKAQGSAGFDDLLSVADIDSLISSPRPLRLQDLHLVSSGVVVDPSAYTESDPLGSATDRHIAPGLVYEHFAAGATILLVGAHRGWPPLAGFCRRLEHTLASPVQANVYVTPAGSSGFDVHFDTHDVFVLQLFGSKSWEVFQRVGEPLAMDAVPPAVDVGAPLLTAELQRGDCLYLPRGYPHRAETVATASAHVTVGILGRTWMDAFRAVMERASEELDLADPLPTSLLTDHEQFGAELAERLAALARWAEHLNSARTTAWVNKGLRAPRSSLLAGQLQRLMELDRVDDHSTVQRRPEASFELKFGNGELTLELRDRVLRIPASLERAMATILASDSFLVSDLDALLDVESRLVLVRRLIREGILEIV